MKGIITRIILGLILLFFPIVLYLCIDKDAKYFIFYCLFIPYFMFLIISRSDCSTCDDCIFSTKCSNMLKAKMVKRFMCFVGYKSDIIKDLKYTSAGYNEKYTNIYRNLKNQYKGYIKAINSNAQD